MMQDAMKLGCLRHSLDSNQVPNIEAILQRRHRIIRSKGFLRLIYLEWYKEIQARLPETCTPVLELGSGPGFLSDIIPGLITSDILWVPGISLVFDGRAIPFKRHSVGAIVMTDVLHHIPDPRAFFREAASCLKPGGLLVMIEPWLTPWSRFVYRNLQDEPFAPERVEWEFDSVCPLSGANIALPWILFHRDRKRFQNEFPAWRIENIRVWMPFRYLLSGGVTFRNLMPQWSFPFWKRLEQMCGIEKKLGMFALLTLQYLPKSSAYTTKRR